MNSKTIDLNPQRWARVEALFDEAADLPADQRDAFLAESCADDIELRGYVASLLTSDFANNTFIEQSIRGVLSLAQEKQDPIATIIGSRIGPYRIVDELGSGGMGIVYLAERADLQFDNQVAIKVVRQRLTDPAVQERLRSERQILADLNHPNIATLVDGGTIDDGTPYLVMEYIDGIPIDEYCDQNEISVNRRLELFRSICAAVHFAHQNLVVHRDIKASNILVTADGTPKLLDFGIARLIDTSGVATDGLTVDGIVLLTPENAAPEQVLNQPITTATDTYALGLLLYRLLTGFSAYRINATRPSEMMRVILEQEPVRASIRVTKKIDEDQADNDRTSLQMIGQFRSTSIEKLGRRLRGDLDVIIMTALRKEPERRYRSVNEFSKDIRLHLQNMPILARADTWSYRSTKFVRRHYVGLAMSILFAAMLVSFGVVTLLQNKRIAAERDTAREVSTFLEEIFMEPDPFGARGVNTTAGEILATGAKRIADQLTSRPEIQATLMETIGRVYFNLGDYDASVEMLEESLRLRRMIFGDDDPTVAISKNELAVTLTRRADYARAGRLLEEALANNRRHFGDKSAAVAGNLLNLAELYDDTGRFDEAEQVASVSAVTYSSLGDPYSEELAEAKNVLARIARAQGNLDRAETLMREAIAIVESKLGSDHPHMAYYLQNLAVLFLAKGDTQAAEEKLHESIAVTQRIFGNEHHLLAGSLVMLGSLLHERGQLDEAERALRNALSIDKKSRSQDHPNIAYDMTSLGMLLHDKGELDEAESLLRNALQIYEKSIDDSHQYVGSALTELGALLNAKGSLAEAEQLLSRAIEIRSTDYPDTHVLAASTRAVYGDTLARQGRYEEAEQILLDSIEILREQKNRRTRRTLDSLVRLYVAWGKPQEAARYRQTQ